MALKGWSFAALVNSLKSAAFLDVGTGSDTVAAGDDSRITGAAQKAQNLNDLADKNSAWNNLGGRGAGKLNVGTTANTVAAGDDSRIVGAAQKAQNLNDLADKNTAWSNLGGKGAGKLDVGTTAGTVAAGNDSRIVGAAQKSQNLNDLDNKDSAWGNLGGKTAGRVDIQTSTQDTTPGRALLFGAFGLGSSAATVSSANSIDGNGFYQTGPDAPGNPVPGVSFTILHLKRNAGVSGGTVQFAFDVRGDSNFYFRNQNSSGGWYDWRQLYDATNPPPKNTALLNTRGWWKCGDTGIIIQWGVQDVAGATINTYSFPTAFPVGNASLLVSNNIERTAGENSMTGYMKSRTQFSLSNTAATPRSICWMAVGW